MSYKNISQQTDSIALRTPQWGRFVIAGVVGLFIVGALFVTNPIIQSSEPAIIVEDSGTVDVTYSDALSLQYAEPFLNQGMDDAVYGEALAQQYAQPWIDQMQSRENTVVTYGDGLSMQYAQPWLDLQDVDSCNGRLDMEYACANGYQP